MRRPSRRTVLASATLAVAVVAGATVAFATRDGGTAAVAPLDLPTSPAASPSPSPSATPTPSETPSPTHSPTPEPTVAPTATRTSSAPAYSNAFGPRPPGSVTVPYQAGQTSWDVRSHDFRIRVSITPPTQGSPMTWTITASSPNAGCCAIALLYGDGYAATEGMACDQPDPTQSFTHIYNRAGRHEFMVQVGDRKSCGASGDGALYGSFDVAPGTSTAQGPSLPTVQFDTSTPVKGHEGDDAYLSLWGEAIDKDGYLTKLVVDFGDGTKKTFAGDPMECRKSMDGWPLESRASLPHDPPPYHRYTKGGEYTVTLTAYSTGCNGTQVQTGSKSFQWYVAEIAPSPSAT